MSLISRSTLLHLRFPFSFFLLPVFLGGLVVCGTVDASRAFLVFAILHFLLYPASNGFNSYFDRDEGPIGGLATPPPVTGDLLAVSLILDLLSVAASFAVSPLFALAVFLYGCGSKLYSWPPTRLKRRPFAGWLATGLGQGGATLIAVVIGVDPAGIAALGAATWIAAILFTFLLFGIFPLTQVYQHEEDRKRGDITISLRLGIKGTFALSAAFLALAVGGWTLFFLFRTSWPWALAFALSEIPALAVFTAWALAARKDGAKADFRNTMRMNLVAAIFMNAFFAFHLLLR